jgi:Trypsin-co-occurring domain 1
MKRLVEFPMESGGSVLVEVKEFSTEDVTRGLTDKPREIAERATKSFEDATSSLTPAAQSLIARFRGLKNPPNEISLEFGVQLSTEAGAFVASVAAEANFKVALTWRSQ